MSKTDDLRALREARYEQQRSLRETKPVIPPKTVPAPAKPTPVSTAAPVAEVDGEPEPEAALCGHRAISGRTCTREQGHAAKSHRYS